jgi:hypothetical protein
MNTNTKIKNTQEISPSSVRTIYLVFAMYYTNTILLITAIVLVAINS